MCSIDMCVCLHKWHGAVCIFRSAVCLGFTVKGTDSADKQPVLEMQLCPRVTLDESFCFCEPWFPHL